MSAADDDTPEARLARWAERDAVIARVAEIEQLAARLAERDREVADLRERCVHLAQRVTAADVERVRLEHLVDGLQGERDRLANVLATERPPSLARRIARRARREIGRMVDG